MQGKFLGFSSHVGSLIRLLKPYVSRKTDISLLSIPTVKSPKKMKPSYLGEYKGKTLESPSGS